MNDEQTRILAQSDWTRARVRYGIGSLGYPLITLIGWFYPPAMLALYAVVVAYYFGPGLRALDMPARSG